MAPYPVSLGPIVGNNGTWSSPFTRWHPYPQLRGGCWLLVAHTCPLLWKADLTKGCPHPGDCVLATPGAGHSPWLSQKAQSPCFKVR